MPTPTMPATIVATTDSSMIEKKIRRLVAPKERRTVDLVDALAPSPGDIDQPQRPEHHDEDARAGDHRGEGPACSGSHWRTVIVGDLGRALPELGVKIVLGPLLDLAGPVVPVQTSRDGAGRTAWTGSCCS